MDLFIEKKFDVNGDFLYFDIAFKNGKLKTVDKIDEIKNRIIVNLNTYLGENYRNVNHGVDYFNNVFGHEMADTITQDELKAAIISTRGVTALTAFNIVKVGRTGELTAQVHTTVGEINLTTTINI